MKFKPIVLAAAVLLSAVGASAQEASPIPLVLTSTGNGSFASTFTRAASGIFVDTFTFTPPAFTGSFSLNLSSVAGPINFFAAILNGEGFGFEGDDTTMVSFSSSVTSGMPLELTVFGFAGEAPLNDAAGSYRATLALTSVAAIPEPETYALLMAGLVFVAMARYRGRRQESV